MARVNVKIELSYEDLLQLLRDHYVDQLHSAKITFVNTDEAKRKPSDTIIIVEARAQPDLKRRGLV